MPKKILVINDTIEILQMFEAILTEEGYAVTLHSYSTRDIIKVIAEKPDLIISDHLPMQEELGWQFLQKLKMTRETANIPLIICTTSNRIVRDNEGRLAEKGVLVVAKPFDIDELVQAVEEMIGKADAKGLGTTSVNPQVAEHST